jgi:ssDNA-binding Zn-finger/Zn-ribbon topoisomerase 1
MKKTTIVKICPKCKIPLKVGIAIENTLRGIPDFIGKEVCTISPGGSGKLISCHKCPNCGKSFYIKEKTNDRTNSITSGL